LFRRRRKIAALVALVLVFAFLSLPLPVSRAVKTTLGNFLSPVTRALSAVGRKVGQIWTVVFHSENVVSEKIHLEEELAAMKAEKTILEEKLRGVESLHEQLGLLEGSGFEVIPADIIGWEPDIWHSTVLINRGTGDGISIGDLATEGDKLVGRVTEVKSSWSRIRLLTDHRSAVPALVQKKMTKGIVVTTAHNRVKMDYIKDSEGVEPGDVIITAHANHRYENEKIVFPQGLIIGTVVAKGAEEQGWYSATIEPAVDFGKLEKISVIVVR
jgi:rod shape-determining protein MreC